MKETILTTSFQDLQAIHDAMSTIQDTPEITSPYAYTNSLAAAKHVRKVKTLHISQNINEIYAKAHIQIKVHLMPEHNMSLKNFTADHLAYGLPQKPPPNDCNALRPFFTPAPANTSILEMRAPALNLCARTLSRGS